MPTDIQKSLDGLRKDICDLKKDFNIHKEKVEPILEGLAASKIFAKFVTWTGGVIIGIGAIYTMAKQVFHL